MGECVYLTLMVNNSSDRQPQVFKTNKSSSNPLEKKYLFVLFVLDILYNTTKTTLFWMYYNFVILLLINVLIIVSLISLYI